MARGSDGSSKPPPTPLALVKGGPKEVGKWWRRHGRQALRDIDPVTLAKAVTDAGVIALAHLIRRLCDEETPEHVRDKIALALGPKVMVQIGVLKHVEHADPQADDLLKAYGSDVPLDS